MLEFPAAITLNRRHAGNAPGRRPSQLAVPAAFLRRHTIMIAFGTLPLLVFGAAAMSRPAPSPPIVAQLVRTEGVRVIRMDSVTFRARWMPVYDMPLAVARSDVRQTVGTTVSVHREQPTTEVRPRTQAVGGEGVVAGTVTGAVVSEPPPRHRLRSRSAGLDVCARHGMHRVNYGKRWRCRR